jgi:long-chain acyl-CoA synthetase
VIASVDGGRRWQALYATTQPLQIAVEYTDALAMFRAAVARAADRPAIRYFDGSLSYRDVDEQSDALATALRRRGFGRGDRLALYLQNVPQFVIGQLAAWKAGGIAVSINPMNRARELRLLLEDSGASVLLMHRYLYNDVAAEVLPQLAQPVLPILTCEYEFQTRNDARVLPPQTPPVAGTLEYAQLVAEHRAAGPPPPVAFAKDDVAIIVYTSGTTGLPKGAMNTHGNVGFTAQVYRDWTGNSEGESIFVLAPLFHITGLIGNIAVAHLNAATLGLTYRFEPGLALETIREHGSAFTIGAITALGAMLHHPSATREHLASIKRIFCGGAAIPPSVANAFEKKFGHRLHNAYGLTETTSPAVLSPLGSVTPVDPTSGSLAVGVPVYDTNVAIVDDDGAPLPVGETGEIVISGPQVVAGYWKKPDETQRALPGGALRTGDVGFMDAAGWLYLVDRKKDMINAAGYKVWPREVEDVLYTHPAVREAAVVGIPDAYRGETVKAVVSFKPGCAAEPADLIAFCRERMAAYKVPRVITFLAELPKTPTGKILRRELRDVTVA